MHWLSLLSMLAFAEPLVLRDAPKTEMRRVVDRVDELLGGTRTDDNQSSSTLRLSASDQISRFTESDPRFDVNFTMKLGVINQWQDRFNEWLNKQWRRVEVGKESPSPAEGKAAASPPEAIRDPWRFTINKHVTVSRHPGFYAHARVMKDWELARFVNTFITEVGWSVANKWEAMSALNFSTPLAPRWTAGFGNQLQWLISDKNFSTSHGLSLAYLPGGDNQEMSIGASVGTAVEKKSWYASVYSLALTYRLSAWQDWILIGASPYVAYAKERHFQADYGVSAKLEVVF